MNSFSERALHKTFVAGAAALVLAGSLAIAGCGAQPGRTAIKLERGTPLTEERPLEVEAQRDGIMALYSTNDMTPKTRFEVKRGDKVGFRRTADGGVEAYAGENTYPVSSDPVFERSFYWKFQEAKSD